MTCKKCGSEIPDGFSFCTECGATAVKEPEQEPVTQAPAYQTPAPKTQYAQPQYEAAQPVTRSNVPDSTPILVLGIISMVIPAIGALICGAICRKKVKQYKAAGGILEGKAMAGNILGTIGFVWGIVSCAIAALWIFILLGIPALSYIASKIGELTRTLFR